MLEQNMEFDQSAYKTQYIHEMSKGTLRAGQRAY